MNEYVVLVRGLNMRRQNRIPKAEQRAALAAVDELVVKRIEQDKGSYLVASNLPASDLTDRIVNALRQQRPNLEIRGAAVASPAAIRSALAELTTVLTATYRQDCNQEDFSIQSDGVRWRAGLAFPLFPGRIQGMRSMHDKLKNAVILGWTDGCVLVLKREAKGIHWGTSVTDPAERRLKRLEHVVVELTSRSGNVLRELVS